MSERSEQVFAQGKEVIYVSSELNHYEGIEICKFKDRITGAELIWHADEIVLGDWKDFLETTPWPK